jgi:hypothetical protein
MISSTEGRSYRNFIVIDQKEVMNQCVYKSHRWGQEGGSLPEAGESIHRIQLLSLSRGYSVVIFIQFLALGLVEARGLSGLLYLSRVLSSSHQDVRSNTEDGSKWLLKGTKNGS